MKSFSEYKTEARMALRDNWTMSVLTAFVCDLLNLPSMLIRVFLGNPVSAGETNAFKKLLDGDKDVLSNTFNMAFEDYTHKLAGMLLRDLYVFLWTLLLIVPGIIKSYAYALTPYLLVDEPDLSADCAIDRSAELMRGNKGRLFCLDLSFIGWGILCVMTVGIGFFWLIPYVKTTRAAFYRDLIESSNS